MQGLQCNNCGLTVSSPFFSTKRRPSGCFLVELPWTTVSHQEQEVPRPRSSLPHPKRKPRIQSAGHGAGIAAQCYWDREQLGEPRSSRSTGRGCPVHHPPAGPLPRFIPGKPLGAEARRRGPHSSSCRTAGTRGMDKWRQLLLKSLMRVEQIKRIQPFQRQGMENKLSEAFRK